MNKMVEAVLAGCGRDDQVQAETQEARQSYSEVTKQGWVELDTLKISATISATAGMKNQCCNHC